MPVVAAAGGTAGIGRALVEGAQADGRFDVAVPSRKVRAYPRSNASLLDRAMEHFGIVWGKRGTKKGPYCVCRLEVNDHQANRCGRGNLPLVPFSARWFGHIDVQLILIIK